MKKIILIFIIVLIAGNATAQNSETKYDTCSALHLREGEWLYTDGQDSIRIYLRYHRSYDPDLNSVKDRLWGWHEYKQGTQVIQSNYQHRFMPLYYNTDNINISNRSIWLRFEPSDFELPYNERRLMGLIRDSGYGNKSHQVNISFSTRLGSLVMIWQQQASEFTGNPMENNNYTMTLPRSFTLVKQ